MAHETFICHKEGADTVVLFIHGFLGSTEHFEKFIDVMPGNISVYNLLLKGHGKTVKDFGKASMKQWKTQVDGVLKELTKRYKNIIITGHSMGTFFAMEGATKYPGKVKSLLLLQSPLKIGVKAEATVNTLKSFFGLMGDDEKAIAYKNSHSVALTMRLWEYIGWIPRYAELFRESKRARKTILALKTPAVIFQAKKDELVSFKSVKYIPDKHNIKLYIMEKSAHFIYDEKDFAFVLEEFLKILSAF